MKHFISIVLFLLLWPALSFAQQPFTGGNIVVYRIGNGTTAMDGTVTQVYLDEYTPSGTLVQSIPMPATGSRITMSTLNTAGLLSLSSNGQYLLVPGVDLPVGAGLTTALIPGSVGVIDFNGNVKSVTTFPIDNFNTISSAVSNNGSNLWFTVSSDGVGYTTAGSSTFTKIQQPAGPSASAVGIADGQLYLAQASGSPQLAKVGTGLPTTPNQPLIVLPGMADPNDNHCKQFAFADLDATIPGNDVLYIASQASSGGGLQKYSLVSGVWTFNGTIGTATDRYHGLAVKVTGGSVQIFASRRGSNSTSIRGGELVRLTDNSGYNGALTGTPTVFASAPVANSLAYRGIAPVPQPAPFTAGNLVVYRIGNGTTVMDGNTTKVFLDEMTPSGTLVQSIQMPTAGKRITMSTLNTAGLITLSANGQYLVVPGVDLPAGTGLSATPIPCSMGIVDYNGVVKSVTTVPLDNLNTISAATSDNGTNLWFTMSSDGVGYTTAGSSAFTRIQQPAGPSASAIDIADGQLYLAQASGSPQLAKVGTGLPTTPNQPLILLPGMADPNDNHCKQFAFADLDAGIPGNDVLYIASQASSGGGLQKYSLVGGVWTLNGTIGTATDRYHGLAVKAANGSVQLFASRRGANSTSFRGGELVRLTDNSGYNGVLTGVPVVIASAPVANSIAYRGIALVPQGCITVRSLQALNVTSSQATLTWTAPPGASGNYEYAITTSATPPAAGAPATTTSVTQTGLTNNITYYGHVRSVCTALSQSQWTTVPFVTTCTAPLLPALSIDVSATGRATIRWNKVFGAQGYEYAVTTGSTAPAAGTATADTSVTIPALSSITKYYIHVRTSCGSGALSAWTTKSVTTECLMPVVQVAAIAGDATTTWNRVGGASKYEYALTNYAAKPVSGSYTTDTAYVVNGLKQGSPQYMHVRSVCTNGAVSEWQTVPFTIAGLQVYPNPVREELKIRLHGVVNAAATVAIADLTGRVIARVQLTGNSASVNTGSWSPGIYLLWYEDGKSRYTVRIVKQ